MEYRVAPSNLFGGGLAGKACLSRLGEGRGRSGICFAKTNKSAAIGAHKKGRT